MSDDDSWRHIRELRERDLPGYRMSRPPGRRRRRVVVALLLVSLVLLPTPVGGLVVLLWCLALITAWFALEPRRLPPRRRRMEPPGEPRYDEDAWTRERVRRFMDDSRKS